MEIAKPLPRMQAFLMSCSPPAKIVSERIVQRLHSSNSLILAQDDWWKSPQSRWSTWEQRGDKISSLRVRFTTSGPSDIDHLLTELGSKLSLRILVGRSDKVPNRPTRNVWVAAPFQLFCNRSRRCYIKDGALVLDEVRQQETRVLPKELLELFPHEHKILPIVSLMLRTSHHRTHRVTFRWHFEPFLIDYGEHLDFFLDMRQAIFSELGLPTDPYDPIDGMNR